MRLSNKNETDKPVRLLKFLFGPRDFPDAGERIFHAKSGKFPCHHRPEYCLKNQVLTQIWHQNSILQGILVLVNIFEI